MDRNGTFVVVRTAETPLFSERGCFLPPFGVTPFPFRIHFVSPFTRTVIPVTTAAVFGALLLSLCVSFLVAPRRLSRRPRIIKTP